MLIKLFSFFSSFWIHLNGCFSTFATSLLYAVSKIYNVRPEVLSEDDGNWTSLHDSDIMCPKNPKHLKFIPMRSFQMSDLPNGFQNPDLYSSILNFSKLVVKISVLGANTSRRQDLREFDVCQQENVTYGSGHLWDASKCRWHNTPCPCLDCRCANARRVGWGELHVFTACHVVSDNEDAQVATVYYSYDDPGRRHAVIELTGHEVVRTVREEDTCEMIAITHSLELMMEIKQQIVRCQSTNRVMCEHEKLTILQKGKYLTVIISHPHGKEKQISIGRCKYRSVHKSKEGHARSVSYVYDTATCPGSSGAPVLVLGKENVTLRYAPHAKGNGNRNRNASGSGQEMVESVGLFENMKRSAVLFIFSSSSFSSVQKIPLLLDVGIIKIKRCFYWLRNIFYRARYGAW